MSGLPYRDKDASSYRNGGDDDEDEEDEAIDSTDYKSSKDAVIFAIAVSDSMLTQPVDAAPVDSKKSSDASLSPTVAALKCAYALMQQRIISHPHDMMGILLFGTEQSRFQDGDSEYPHCYLLTDLDVPSAADVRRLRSLVQDEEEAAELLVPSKEEVSMANVLFCANQIFTTRAPNFASRRLFLVTDNDYPHAQSRDARNSAAVRAKDLYDLGVTIELFPISHPDRNYTFDRARFYNDIVYSATPSDPDAPAPLVSDVKAASSSSSDGITLLASLLSSISSRSAPRRALFSACPLELSPMLKISVKGFILLKRQEPKRTSYIYLPPSSSARPQIAVGTTTLVADDTARSVEKVEIRKAFKFGGETITFTLEEMAAIKNYGDPVIRVIGFKPLSMLPEWANMKPSTFIYPSEDEVVGSTRVFAALHATLLRDKKMGLVWFIPRRNAAPVLAALLPGAEKRSANSGDQLVPPGLWIRPLPFADDIRVPPPLGPVVRSPDSLTDAMRTVIQQLQLPKGVYDPSKYPNPSLQWFYRILQALALEEDVPEKAEDKTLPRWRQMHKRAGQYVVEWGKLLDDEVKTWQSENGSRVVKSEGGGTKRAANSGNAGTVAKKVKLEADAEGGESVLTDVEVRKMWEKDALGKLKVADLKAWLKEKGISAGAGAKKADLITKIESWFEGG